MGFYEIKNSVSCDARGSTVYIDWATDGGGLSAGARTLPTTLVHTLFYTPQFYTLVLATFTWPFDNINNLSLGKQYAVVYNGNWNG